jgi:hypothetical protein
MARPIRPWFISHSGQSKNAPQFHVWAYRQPFPRIATGGVGTLENHGLAGSGCAVGACCAIVTAGAAGAVRAVVLGGVAAGAGLGGGGAATDACAGHVGQAPSTSIVPHRRQYCGMSMSMPLFSYAGTARRNLLRRADFGHERDVIGVPLRLSRW